MMESKKLEYEKISQIPANYFYLRNSILISTLCLFQRDSFAVEYEKTQLPQCRNRYVSSNILNCQQRSIGIKIFRDDLRGRRFNKRRCSAIDFQ